MRSTDEVYGSLAYDGAPLLRVHLCVNRTFLVKNTIARLRTRLFLVRFVGGGGVGVRFALLFFLVVAVD